MEIAKFVLTAIGTFLSVFALSFTIFQYWRKKQDEKFTEFKDTVGGSLSHLEKRVEFLERSILHAFENRLSVIEGELKGLKPILTSIQNWFINNTPSGGK